ncbi:Carboxymuconolactone decarboxylase family protein [Blastochloris viridis]|nr:Carboxymuconolactone decarboxylase family protein [Blastochloris viridis]CUU42063.1 Arsenate reductase, glutaredoxin family [Blastochloris viridis]
MPFIEPKPIAEYPWYLRLFFRNQVRRYGQVLSPSWLWGRLPGHFLGLLILLGLFQRRAFPIDTALRSALSVRVAQINGCAFCVDLNAYNLLKAAGAADKAAAVEKWRTSPLFSECERAALAYAETMTDTAKRVTASEIDALRPHFDDDGITALTAWIAFQNFSAKFNAALGAEDAGLCRLPPSRSAADG